MPVDLYKELKTYGPAEQVTNTIARIKAKQNWSDFLNNYEPGKIINPHAIKTIVEKYYNSLPDTTSLTATNVPDTTSLTATTSVPTGLKFIKEERLPTGSYSHFHQLHALETWYFYEDENGHVIESKTKLHGGKKKSRRNRKSKKSRKNLRKSNRR
jgi:hypothetical protein